MYPGFGLWEAQSVLFYESLRPPGGGKLTWVYFKSLGDSGRFICEYFVCVERVLGAPDSANRSGFSIAGGSGRAGPHVFLTRASLGGTRWCSAGFHECIVDIAF